MANLEYIKIFRLFLFSEVIAINPIALLLQYIKTENRMKSMYLLIWEASLDNTPSFSYPVYLLTFWLHLINIISVILVKNSMFVRAHWFLLYSRPSATTDITSNILNYAWEHRCDLKLTFLNLQGNKTLKVDDNVHPTSIHFHLK